ncbi:hypothetical protein OEZ49_11420 [Ruegeria sp. WL0004]|uniref:Cytochrome C oxidase assembly protein n=1 Tax=Ruegeria marisflavi TaxID=2984152 RepID=A0ABT2WWK3_9RHOB|nr:hypothetical protein [Ruegeria sp. WL0004]MCU9838378.1 hypothetical protein [Ruegeria sp. WL0004]
MSLRPTHELHQRRFGRNLGVALTLAGFIVIIFGLTVVKVTRGDFEPPRGNVEVQN